MSVDRDGLDVIEDLRLGCSGRLAEVGGRLKLLIGAPGAAVYSFSDREIVVTQDQSFEPFPTIANTHNTITGVYPEPAQRWADKDAPEQSSPELLARDDGERLAVSFRFDAVFISAQVQSLTSTMILDEQRWRTHELTLPPNAAPLEPNDPVAWSSDENGYSNKKFLVVRAIPLAGRLQRVVIKEIDPSDYDPPSIIVPPVIGWIGPVPVPPQPMYGWQVFPATLPDAEGNPRYPTIEVRCAPGQDDVSYIRVQVKLTATDELVFDSGDATVMYEPPYAWVLNAVLAGNADYQARGKFVPASNRPTEWGGWLPVRTPNIDGSDITVGLGQVRDDVKNRIMELQHQMDQLAGIVESLSMSVATSDMDAKLDRDVMRSELGGAVASVIDERETRVTAEGAMARRLSAVRAEMGNVLAEGYLSMKANTVDDELANVEIGVRAKKGEQAALGAILLEAYLEGGQLKTREIHYADRFIFVAPDGTGGQGVVTFGEDGMKLAVADIGTIRAGLIEGNNGKMTIDIKNGRIRIRS